MTKTFHISDNVYRIPETWRDILPTKEIREIVLYHNGKILAKGEFWLIKHKSRGLGLHDVWLERDTKYDVKS